MKWLSYLVGSFVATPGFQAAKKYLEAVGLSGQPLCPNVDALIHPCDQWVFTEYYNGSDPDHVGMRSSFPTLVTALGDTFPNMLITEFDCNSDPEACLEVGLIRLPARHIHRRGKSVEYTGPLESEAMINRIQRAFDPAPLVNGAEGLALIYAYKKPLVFLIHPSKATASERREFETLAQIAYDLVTCVQMELVPEWMAKVVPEAKVDKTKAMWLYVPRHSNQYDYDVATVHNEFSLNQFETLTRLGDFLNIQLNPGMEEFREQFRPPLLADVLAHPPNGPGEINSLAGVCENQILFVGCQFEYDPSHSLYFSKSTLFAIHHFYTWQMVTMDARDHPDGLTLEAVEEFVADYLIGAIKLRSEPLPSNKGHVTKLVGHNVLDVLSDASRTVFVNYCSPCHEDPVWNSLGAHYANNESVIIAQFDYTKNEQVPGKRVLRPTLALYRVNEENDANTGSRRPYYYDGEYNVADMVGFIDNGGEYDSVPELTMTTIKEFVKKHELVTVLFYQPSLIGRDPSYFTKVGKFAQIMAQRPNDYFGRVNCDQELYLCGHYLQSVRAPVPRIVDVTKQFFGQVKGLYTILDMDTIVRFTNGPFVLHLNPTGRTLGTFLGDYKLLGSLFFEFAWAKEGVNPQLHELYPQLPIGCGPSWWVVYPGKYGGMLEYTAPLFEHEDFLKFLEDNAGRSTVFGRLQLRKF